MMSRMATRLRLPLAVTAVVALLVAALVGQGGDSLVGEVVGVTDGDTIRVMRSGREVRVRLDGIDAPESGQDFSRRAEQLTSSLVFGNVVQVNVRDVDRYGRLVARVLVDGTDVSVALVEQGLAWHYTLYSDDPVLAEAEQSARRAEIGLWSRPNPIPPWDYRRGDRAVGAEPTDGLLHGNRRSKVFHRPGCANYDCPNCTVTFETREEAISQGFRPAGDCHP